MGTEAHHYGNRSSTIMGTEARPLPFQHDSEDSEIPTHQQVGGQGQIISNLLRYTAQKRTGNTDPPENWRSRTNPSHNLTAYDSTHSSRGLGKPHQPPMNSGYSL